jgi:hypothetical protein
MAEGRPQPSEDPMPPDDQQHSTSPPAQGTAWHLKQVMESLDVHIARLALALGVPLDTRTGVSEAMRDRPAEAPGSSQAAHRLDELRAELRGLMVLRDKLIAQCADELGRDAARQVVMEVESHLRANGFKPGADGIALEPQH